MGSNRRDAASQRRMSGRGSAVTIKIDGLKELEAGLGELKKATARTVANRALLKAANPMVEAIKGHAPVSPITGGGALRDSIIASTKSVAGNDAYATAMRKGLGAAAAVEAKREALRSQKGGALSVIFVGPARKRGSRATKIAHLVEYGTAAHIIKPKASNATGRMSFEVGGRRVMPDLVEHPGARPHPFMRPGFEETKEQCLGLVKTELASEISRAAERARRKALRQKG